jgi:GNAT superfamily N-acetyltransferase
MSAPFVIRQLTSTNDWEAAFPVVHELRPHLTLEDYLARMAMMTGDHGFELYAAFDATGALVGVMGLRLLVTLSRGRHLHIDDLVTTAQQHGRGVGAALLAHAEALAHARSATALFLDSRPTAETFYLAQGFIRHPPFPMKKLL